MKRYVLPVVTAVVLAFGPAASAQVVVPEGGDVDMNGSGRVEGSGRTPGTGRTEGTGRTPGTGRTGDPNALPATGGPIGSVAMDGATLLGAGLVLLHARKRLQSS